MSTRTRSPYRALRWFGFKQALRGAIIIGVLAGFMLILQGFAYAKAYPDEASRAQFAASLKSASALGFLYGDPRNLDAGASGYMVYRVVGFMGLIASVWGLLATTRLLRGSEEDGRWEAIRSSSVTARAGTWHVMAGFAGAWLVALAISTLVMSLAVASPDIKLSLGAAIITTLMIFVPGLLFAALGILTSQLALTRRRAVMYGIVPIVALFLLRGIGNTNPDVHWLSVLTPFGWAERVNPIIGLQLWWFALFAVFIAAFVLLGLRLAQRDIGSSVIKESDTARSRFGLLSKSWQLALRLNIWVFAGWSIAILAMSALITSLADIAVEVTDGSRGLADSIEALAGNAHDLKIAFIGSGLMFVVIVLMVLATVIVSAIRGDEAKQYLDNILIQPQRRTSWLAGRLLLGLAVLATLLLATGVLTWIIGAAQDIGLSFGKVIATSLSFVGILTFLLGLGALVYGLLPRAAVIVMYVVIGWSFVVSLLASALTLNDIVVNSSLLQHVSLNLAQWPNWTAPILLFAIGTAMAALGVLAFDKRDIVSE